MEVNGSDHVPFFSWVMAVGEPAVNLPGCKYPPNEDSCPLKIAIPETNSKFTAEN